MPFGEGTGTVQLRLPFPNKKTVYVQFRKFYSDSVNKTTDLAPILYSDATALWKTCPELANIKVARHKSGFSKCNKCHAYDRSLKCALTNAQREELD